jgi:hypothetical protein
MRSKTKTKDSARIGIVERVLLVSTTIVGAALFARSVISPLIGYDSPFRWDYLAQRLFSLHRFDFYPPLQPADFHNYFAADAIPPLVSFAYWWLYASAGRYAPSLIALFVLAQFAATLAFTYGAASALFSRRAGFLAAAMLAACPLYFRAVLIGQETGLTALSIAGVIYFVVSGRQQEKISPMVSAGLAAGLSALSREYGWIALPVGIIALLWTRQRLKHVLVFAVVATAAALPWYVRTWMLTGNPFYPLSFANFAVNPVYNGILEHYRGRLSVQNWTIRDWTYIFEFLVLWAPLQVLTGIAGGIQQFRQRGYLLVIAGLIATVWLQSASYTSGGIEASTRVLSPALVVLSILGAGLLTAWTASAAVQKLVVVTVVVCQMWTAVHAALYPRDPLTVALREWRSDAFQPTSQPIEFEVRDQLVRLLPAGTRVLSDNAYLHAALIDKGIEVVPVWSPEVRFLFSSTPEEAQRRLQALGIASVAYYPESLNTSYLVSASPFYASLPEKWHVLTEVPGFLKVFVPDG